MTPEKWENIIGTIKDNFQVIDEGVVNLAEEGGAQIKYIVFDGPLGRLRLEFIVKPAILGKKTTYSKRIGSETKVDYIYSDTEKTYALVAYKWSEDESDWIEIEAEKIF